MSAAEPPQGANSAPAGGSAAAKPQAWGDDTSAPEPALRQLQALGADAFAHVNGSLAVHLRGTEALLRRWGNREAVCLGGLYHAVYGTDRITGSLADLGTREAIAEVIGSEAESLAYLYGACARKTFHPRIGTPGQLMFADRFTHCEYPIAASQLRDLCEMTVANEVDLALANARFRGRYGAELIEFFERMQGLASEAALAAARETLRPTRHDAASAHGAVARARRE